MTEQELAPRSRASSGDHPPRPGGDRQRLADVPLLRDHAAGLLHLAPALSGAWTGGRAMRSLPGHRVQVDVKFIAPLPGSRKKHYQFTAIADCTRIRVLRIYDRLNQQSAIRFLDYVLEKLPFKVEVIQTDNGGEFGSQFHCHVLDRGIGHVYIKPATPRLNGKVERSHRIDAEEFYRMLEDRRRRVGRS
jgi:transposase InsO family protein